MLYPAELPGPRRRERRKDDADSSKMTAGDKPDIDASLDRIEPVACFSPRRITRFRRAGGARRALAPLWAPPWGWFAAARPRRLAASLRARRRSKP